MIDKRELLDEAAALSLLPHVVEKDYALGWALAGIYAHPDLEDSWIFKCLHAQGRQPTEVAVVSAALFASPTHGPDVWELRCHRSVQ